MEMENKDTDRFFVDKDAGIVLYGAATVGSLLYERLTSNGYRVTGFMDMRAGEIKSLCGCPVYPVQSDQVDRNSIVIISVKNVFEHSRIAAKLIEHGFRRLIYRPFACLNGGGSEADREINSMYDKLEEGEFTGWVPVSQQRAWRRPVLKGVVGEDDDSITMHVPITLLYSDKKEGVEEFPVLFLKPHLDFVRQVLGLEGGGIKAYVDFCKTAAAKVGGFETTKAWESNVIRNRAEVYARMNHMYYLEKDFFVLHAPDVMWNDEKRAFNLKSGKHRATFLAVKRENYVTVKMSKADFDKWVNFSMVSETGDILERQRDESTAAPIENPFFYEYAWETEAFWFELLRRIMKEIADEKYCGMYADSLSGLKILIGIADNGFLKRFFRRCGFWVYMSGKLDACEYSVNVLTGLKEGYLDIEPVTELDFAVIDTRISVLKRGKRIKKAFLISDIEIEEADAVIMNGIYQERQIWIYMKKDVIL